jgi:hypothetical protein
MSAVLNAISRNSSNNIRYLVKSTTSNKTFLFIQVSNTQSRSRPVVSHIKNIDVPSNPYTYNPFVNSHPVMVYRDTTSCSCENDLSMQTKDTQDTTNSIDVRVNTLLNNKYAGRIDNDVSYINNSTHIT